MQFMAHAGDWLCWVHDASMLARSVGGLNALAITVVAAWSGAYAALGAFGYLISSLIRR